VDHKSLLRLEKQTWQKGDLDYLINSMRLVRGERHGPKVTQSGRLVDLRTETLGICGQILDTRAFLMRINPTICTSDPRHSNILGIL
jgi:hypothetical protein